MKRQSEHISRDIDNTLKVVNQNILSAKHLLVTNSIPVTFEGPFSKFFNLYMTDIMPIITENSVENINDYAIYINPNDIQKNDDFDDDTEFSTVITNGSFYIVDMTTGEMTNIHTTDGTEVYITPNTMSLMKKGKGYIKFADMDPDEKVFSVEIYNNGLTKPLYDIMNLTNKRANKNEDISSVCQKMLQLCIDSGIDASVVAGEAIINRIIRAVRPDGTMSFYRPDFTCRVMPEYVLGTITSCLEHNANPHVGLSAQWIKRQMLSSEFTERTELSYLTPLYSKYVNSVPEEEE